MLSVINAASTESLNSLHYSKHCQKVATGIVCLQPGNLPPTSSAASFHSLRVYLLVQEWKQNQLWPHIYQYFKRRKGRNCDGTTNKTCNCRHKNNCPLNGNCLQSSVIYQLTVTRTTTTPLKHTLHSQKPTSNQDTEITPHYSATPSTKTPPNLANTSGHSRTTTLTILFHDASYHLTLPKQLQLKMQLLPKRKIPDHLPT